MSRQKSNGLGYFPLDVDFFEKDKRIRRLIGRFNSDGALFYIYLLCKIYEHSYYIVCDDDFMDDAATDLRCSKEKIGLMLDYLLNKLLLDRKLFDTVKVLTSHGIQKQYQMSCKAMKRTCVDVDERLWILSSEETSELIQVHSVYDNSKKKDDNSGNNQDNSEKKAAKESKENKREVNDNERDTSTNVEVGGELPPDPTFISLILNNKTYFEVPVSRVEKWKELYPAVDVEQELRKMCDWCESNPTKRKTRTGILAFISRWLAAEQNKGGSQSRSCTKDDDTYHSFDIKEFEEFTLYGPSSRKETT